MHVYVSMYCVDDSGVGVGRRRGRGREKGRERWRNRENMYACMSV